MAAALGGCTNMDAFLWDPSIIGRWERTPTSIPVLDRLTVIEGPADDFVEYSEPTADDIIPDAEDYRIGGGDILDVTVWDIPDVGKSAVYQRTVDSRGYIDLPQLGRIRVAGRTADEARQALADAMQPLVAEPLASVVVSGQRQQMFNVVGAVADPGPYFIPSVSEYRLFDVLAAAGWFGESTTEHIFIIRQVPLSEEVRGAASDAPKPPPSVEPKATDDPGRLIEELTDPKGAGGGGGSPSVWATQPADPPIDLIDSKPAAQPESAPPAQPATGDSSWVFLNGKWVLVKHGEGQPGAPEAVDVLPERDPQQLVTQRVIRVPVAPLLAGDSTKNVIIRAGDIVRVPPPISGQVYMGGEVVRPGTYNLPASGRLTLSQAVIAAGGLAPTAIPNRVDLTRKLPGNRQATIQVNLRAITERTQPNIFLKPEDEIIIGTNFWAFPWAVLRGGFRATYGYGFLLDRNFGNDIFGAPPNNNGFQG